MIAMNWLFLTILAITARATFSLGTKLLSRDVKVSVQTQSLLLPLGSGLLALIISPFFGWLNFHSIQQNLIPMLIIISSQVVGNVLYFNGQKFLDAGITQIALSSTLVWGTMLSIVFLKSRFSFLQFFGIVVMMLAIALIQNKKRGAKINFSILYIMGAAVSFSVFQVVSAFVSTRINTATYLTTTYLGTALLTFLIYVKTIKADAEKLASQLKNTFSKTLFASGTSLLYFVFSYLAYRYAPDRGVVVILLTAQVVLSVIFGILFLKEKDNMAKKLLAGALAFIAGVLIKV